VERARQAGVAFPPIPGNDHDDLEARFDLKSRPMGSPACAAAASSRPFGILVGPAPAV